MNSQIIIDTARATLAGTLSFPESVGRLLAESVESYHVDYMAMRMTFYSGAGELVTTPISYSKLPPVARDFDGPALRAAFLDSQQNGQAYRDFTSRAMVAGVQGYLEIWSIIVEMLKAGNSIREIQRQHGIGSEIPSFARRNW